MRTGAVIPGQPDRELRGVPLLRLKIYISAVLVLLLLLTGCSGPAPAPAGSQDGRTGTDSAPSAEGPYEAPPFADAAFHADRAEGQNGVSIDLSETAQGYVAVSANSEKRLKFQVIKDDTTYNYDLSSDGTPSIFPLQSGDGDYTMNVMENITGTKYARLYTTSCSVKMTDEYQPFLRPSDYADYDEKSDCVVMANEFSENAGDALGLVSAVYTYISKNISYDYEKAKTVKSGYLPEPDDTLRTGKGICFDYAALAAAMLRSQGIPTKIVRPSTTPTATPRATGSCRKWPTSCGPASAPWISFAASAGTSSWWS